MPFEFSNEKQVDKNGTVSLTCTKVDGNGDPVMSYPIYLNQGSDFELAKEQAEAWVVDNPSLVAAYVEPTVDKLRDITTSNILQLLEGLVFKITSKYLQADQLMWRVKEAEALAYLDMPEADRTLNNFPEVAAEMANSHPDATDIELIQLLDAEMPKIKTKAELYRDILGFTQSIREEAKLLIATAVDEDALTQIFANTQAKMVEFAASKGL